MVISSALSDLETQAHNKQDKELITRARFVRRHPQQDWRRKRSDELQPCDKVAAYNVDKSESTTLDDCVQVKTNRTLSTRNILARRFYADLSPNTSRLCVRLRDLSLETC